MIAGHVLFYACTGLWLLFEIYLHVFFNRKVTSSNREKKTKYMMLFLFTLATLGGRYASPGFRENFLQPFTLLRYSAVPFLLAALGIRLSSVLQLGKSFSVNLGVQSGQKLQTDGFYKYIRHPGYFSLLLGFCGIGIAFYHPVGTSICVALSSIGIYIRIREEERILLAHFGDSYREYSKRTKSIIPFIV